MDAIYPSRGWRPVPLCPASQREDVFTRFNGQPPFASAGAKNADGLEILYWVATMSVPFPVVMTT